MESEFTFKQVIICFAINAVLFLLAGLLCTLERGGY